MKRSASPQRGTLLVHRVIRSRPAEPSEATPPSDGAFMVHFHNAKLVTPSGLVAGDLWMQGGVIVDPQVRFWQRRRAAADRRIDCQGMVLAPGMIDVMLHEAFGVNFSSLGEAGAAAEAEVAPAASANASAAAAASSATAHAGSSRRRRGQSRAFGSWTGFFESAPARVP